MVSLSGSGTPPLIPSVVVVDPRFDAYGPLVAAARAGRIDLHLRACGHEALALARRLQVDAWLVASDLDDMAGADLVALLDSLPGRRQPRNIAFVGATSSAGANVPAASSDRSGGPLLSHPISLDDVERLVRQPAEGRRDRLPAGVALRRGIASLPVGIGAAVITVAVLLMG